MFKSAYGKQAKMDVDMIGLIAIISIVLGIFSLESFWIAEASLQNLVLEDMPRGEVDPNYKVNIWAPSKTWNGTTLFGDSINGQVVEVNMWGEVVWRYKVSQAGTTVTILGVMILPGGNVLFTVLFPEEMRGVYEVNRQGQLVWLYKDKRVSHDAVRLPNGNTLITAAYSEELSPWPYTDPQVFEVNPSGEIVWAWHAKDLFANDPKYKDVRGTDFGPWTHTNEALRLPDGTTLINPRNFNITIIVDSAGKLVKAFGDPCLMGCGRFGHVVRPHSPIPLPNGNVLISEPPIGRAVEFDLVSRRVVWHWPQEGRRGSEGWLFVRAAQRLPNGNTLVVDSFGQLVEVTPEWEKVWVLKCACYAADPNSLAPFFQAERLSYMPPSFMVEQPVQGRAYNDNKIPLNIREGLDVGKITYSLFDHSKNTWIVQNATVLENVFKDSLTAPTKTRGPEFHELPNGEYTLRILSSSTGFGYKEFVTPKWINYAVQDLRFSVNKPPQPTTAVTVTTSPQIITTQRQDTTQPTQKTETVTPTSLPQGPAAPQAPSPDLVTSSILVVIVAGVGVAALFLARRRKRG